MSDYTRLRTPFLNMSFPSLEYLNTLFTYTENDLFWKIDRARGKIKAGDLVGSITSSGYKRVMINYKEYPLHRIVFFMHYGYVPKIIDHINGNPLDNNIKNLRDANAQTNQYNRKRGINNTSGCKNVSWHEKNQVWQVHVRCNKKVKYWYVKDFELAEFIAQEARSLYHGSFANHV